jgi:predicted RNase H-like HicB family nuclease
MVPGQNRKASKMTTGKITQTYVNNGAYIKAWMAQDGFWEVEVRDEEIVYVHGCGATLDEAMEDVEEGLVEVEEMRETAERDQK